MKRIDWLLYDMNANPLPPPEPSLARLLCPRWSYGIDATKSHGSTILRVRSVDP